MGKNNIINKCFTILAYAYIVLPIIIFLIGWCSWYISIPGTIILSLCFFRLIKNNTLPTSDLEWSRLVFFKSIFIIGIITLWVYFSGVGAFVWQNGDHYCRNAIFEILIDYDWPVVSKITIGNEIQTRGLIYYIGFWLPAALFGKLFGTTAGYCFTAVWAVLGISLFYYLICLLRKKIQIWPLIIFIFMSGLDILWYYLTGNVSNVLAETLHIEGWSTFYQFSSFTSQLFWVFNQAIPAWLIFMLIFLQKNNRYTIFILSFTLLQSTFPFIGMLPFLLYFVLSRKYEGIILRDKKWWYFWCRDTLSFENIVGGGIVGIISFIYLIGNTASQNIEAVAKSTTALLTNIFTPAMPLTISATPINLSPPLFSSLTTTTVPTHPDTLQSSTRWMIFMWIVFIIIEVGIYWISLYKYQKKNPLFYMLLIWLCICPWIRVGIGIDFCMRASIPALVLLYLLIIQTLEASYVKKDYLIVIILSILLVIGSITPLNEIRRTINQTSQQLANGSTFFALRQSDESILCGYNFSGEINNSIFFQYFSK